MSIVEHSPYRQARRRELRAYLTEPALTGEEVTKYLARAREVGRAQCAYCGKPAVQMDHVFSKALRRRFPDWADVTVPACVRCNMVRGTRRLLPPVLADRQAEIEELTGKKWKVWHGEQVSEVLR